MSDIEVNHRKFKLKQCEVTRFEDEFGHSYEIDDEPVAGVTTLLSMGTPIESGLLEYFKRNDKETQEDILLDAQERGSNVHQAVEALLLGLPVESKHYVRKREKLGIQAFVDFFETVLPTDVLTEQVVAFKKDIVKFAGTLDFIGTINGKRILIDFKTGTTISIKNSLQVQAYKMAIQQSTDEKIDDCYVLHLGTGHKGTRATLDSNGLPSNGVGWQLVKSTHTPRDFGLAYQMALLMNKGEYPTPPKVVAFPEKWQILEVTKQDKEKKK